MIGLALTVSQGVTQSTYTPYTFTTLAGNGSGGSRDGVGNAARFNQPYSIAVDGAGNLYVADRGNSTIRKVTPAGAVTTLAGLAGFYGSTDGKASAARFGSAFLGGPNGVAADHEGNVYVADTPNHTIRKVTPAGVVTTLAGLAGSYGRTDGPGNTARFTNPSGVTVDTDGNVYVTDNHAIRKVTPSGVVTTLAGVTGSDGRTDGTGSAARFSSPSAIAVDSAGNIYVADAGNFTIRKVTPTGVVTTFAGTAGSQGSTDGIGSGALFGAGGTQAVGPAGVAVDNTGNVFVADTGNHTIRKATPEGLVTTLAGFADFWGPGSVDGVGITARFYSPQGVIVDTSGNVYVADTGNHTIRKVTSSGEVTTLAGLSGGSGATDGNGSLARFNWPQGLAVNSVGTVYVADTGNHTIRKVTSLGEVTTVAGLASNPGSEDGMGNSARFSWPQGVAVDRNGNIYVADTQNFTIRKVTPAGEVTTLAGQAGMSGNTDGSGVEARFSWPGGVAVDASDTIYVADSENHTIRKVTPSGVVTTLPGASFSLYSLAVDNSGNVLVADRNNQRIMKVTPAGEVITLAGLAGSAGSADGLGSAARFNLPWGLGMDDTGNVYVTDLYNSSIRRITATGVVTTLAGLAGNPGNAEGTGSIARFNQPTGVALDGGGNIYVADSLNHTIRKGMLSQISATIDASDSRLDSNSGEFGFVVTGPAGQLVVMEASTDMVSWLPLSTNTFSGDLNFNDAGSSAYSNRFYRARLP